MHRGKLIIAIFLLSFISTVMAKPSSYGCDTGVGSGDSDGGDGSGNSGDDGGGINIDPIYLPDGSSNSGDACRRDCGGCTDNLDSVYYTQTITYYVARPQKKKSFTFCYDSYTQNAVTQRTFTKTYTAFVVGEQPTCRVSFDYTSFVTRDGQTCEYIDHFSIPVPQEPNSERFTLHLTKYVSLSPQKIFISVDYTIPSRSSIRDSVMSTFKYTNYNVYEPLERSYSRCYTHLVPGTPKIKYFFYTFASLYSTAPETVVITRMYTKYMTQAPVKKIEYIHYKGQLSADLSVKTFIKTFSSYITYAPIMETYTGKFTYSVPSKPRMVIETLKLDKYITSSPSLRKLLLHYTRYPIVPLQMQSTDLTITYYVTGKPIKEMFTDMHSFYYYQRPLGLKDSFRVSDWVESDSVVTSYVETYTSYVSHAPIRGVYCVTVPHYVFGNPIKRFLLRSFTSYSYPAPSKMSFTISYTNYVTQKPQLESECITFTECVEGGLLKEDDVMCYTSHVTCAPVTRSLIISYTTYCNRV